jgi:hypothetical protein
VLKTKWPEEKVPVANPTTAIYNNSAVNNYNATSSLVRFGNINIFFCNKNVLAYYIPTTLAMWL